MTFDQAPYFRRALYWICGAHLLALAFRAMAGAELWPAALPAAGFLVTLWVTRARPSRYHRYAWFGLTCWLAALAGEALSTTRAALPASFQILPLFVLVAVILGGFVVGCSYFAVSLAALAAFWVKHPTSDAWELTLRVNVVLASQFTLVLVLAFGLTYRRWKNVLGERTRELEARLAERSRLSQTFVTALEDSIAAMALELGKVGSDALQPLRRAHQKLSDALRTTQQALAPPPDEPQERWTEALSEFRTQTMRLVLWISLFTLILILVRTHATGAGVFLGALFYLTFVVALLVLLERRFLPRPLVAVAVVSGTLLTMLASMVYWRLGRPLPSAPFIATTAYTTMTIGRRSQERWLAGCACAVLCVPVLFGGADSTDAQVFYFTCLLATVLMMVFWHLMEGTSVSLLAMLEQRAGELARLELFRKRICGTLFHDVANPVAAIGMLLSMPELEPHDRALLDRMQTRLRRLVGVMSEVLADDEPLPKTRIDRVPLDELFRDMQELFGFRLREKEQSLSCALPDPVAVFASPELLRESVVANLLSNAIKFSPPRSQIELSARRDGDHVEIVVRDRGPGWPDAIVERLERGDKIHSTPGSSGETGLGLGLTLTREHLRRMHGDLELRAAAGGGSEAVICLPLAF
jgi:signal transduction histidine kinase